MEYRFGLVANGVAEIPADDSEAAEGAADVLPVEGDSAVLGIEGGLLGNYSRLVERVEGIVPFGGEAAGEGEDKQDCDACLYAHCRTPERSNCRIGTRLLW